jgi:hypothetical protein
VKKVLKKMFFFMADKTKRYRYPRGVTLINVTLSLPRIGKPRFSKVTLMKSKNLFFSVFYPA